MLRQLIILCALGAVASCSPVGPNYARPDVAMQAKYAVGPTKSVQIAAEHPWWTDLRDETLNGLVARGLAQNLTLSVAQARIEAAEAQLATTGPATAFSGSGTLSATRTWQNSATTDSHQFRLGPNFLFDLFGQRRRSFERLGALRAAAVFDAAAARLTIQETIVRTYIDARFFQQAVALQRRTLANRVRVLDILRERSRLGDETKLALRRAEAEVAVQRAQLPELEAGFQSAAFALAALLAEPGETVLDELSHRTKSVPLPRGGLAPGVPAALLHNRPDIRAAEARLMAAVANVGVSEAQLYPSLQLGGVVSVGTTDFASLTPSLTLPLFDQTARKARLRVAQAQAREAEAQWRETVQTALQEVQSGLAQTHAWHRQVHALERASRSYTAAGRLSREAFDLNAITLLEIIDTEDNISATERRLIQAKRTYAQSWAGLSVALGQGWSALISDGS